VTTFEVESILALPEQLTAFVFHWGTFGEAYPIEDLTTVGAS
jgi:hypothetical protein